jgi:hypothetical protein
MPIVNLTDLTIRLADENDEVYQTFEPDESLEVRSQGAEEDVSGVPVEKTKVTAIEGLPDPEDGTFYIVPQPVAHTLNRADLLTPDTGPSAIREDDGTVYAVRQLFGVWRDA